MEDRKRIAAVLSVSTPQHNGFQKDVRDGPVMVSLDMAIQIQGTLQQIGAAFPPDLADAFVLAINACYTRPYCLPTAASEAIDDGAGLQTGITGEAPSSKVGVHVGGAPEAPAPDF